MGNILRDKTIFWSRLGFGYDPPLLDEEGLPVLFNDTLSELNYHKMFYDKGIKLHSFLVNSGWIGIDKYDYTITDKVMDAAASIGDDILLIPRIKLNPPLDWCKKYPEELFVYDAPKNAEEIKNMVDTPKHDILGYEAPNGYYMGAPEYKRPNVGGEISLQSFSSDVWLKDAKEALKRFIEHVEARYSNKILGYHVAYGVSGETILWGRESHRYGDYGINHIKKFKAYLKDTYHIDADIPTPDERYKKHNTIEEFLRVNNNVSVYFDEFTAKVNAHAAEELCKTVKEVNPERLSGIFYGYLVVHNVVYTGHTEIDYLLNSPYVDFFAAPKSYYRCSPGDSGGEISIPQSINLKKVWVDECDVRTHLTQKADKQSDWLSDDVKQTKNALIRELSKNVSHNSGLWFMDLGGGWYNDPAMMDIVEELNSINEFLRQREPKSASDILVLIDERSILQAGVSEACFRAYCKDFVWNAKKAGVLIDIFRLSDVKSIDLSQYKAIVFGYTYIIDDETFDYIKKNSTASFIFNYAAGAINNGTFSLSNTEKISGFKLRDKGVTQYDFPNIEIVSHEDVIFENDEGKVCVKNVDGRTHIMNAIPFLDIHTIRKLLAISGCHFYSSENTIIYGDERFITVLSDGKAYNDYVYLKAPKKWHNVLTGEKGEGDKMKLTLQPFESALFILE